MRNPKMVSEVAAMSDARLQNALANQAATELIDQSVSFDFKKFLNEVGPSPSFGQPLGPTPQCLSVDAIHSYHHDELTEAVRSSVEQHVTVCTICSEHVRGYVAVQPRVMPEELFQRISFRIGVNSRKERPQEKEPTRQFVWPAVPQLFRWVAAPAVALLVFLWVLSPATPYFEHASSRLRDAWTGFRGNETRVPNDPRELQGMLNNLVQASNRGQLPAPHRVDRLLESISAKSTLTLANDPEAHLWITGRTQLAAFDAVSHYEVLRKKTANDAVSLKDLKISALRDIDGVPAITVDSPQINNADVKALLEEGVAQSGIPRLYVFQGSKLVYDISAKPLESTPPAR